MSAKVKSMISGEAQAIDKMACIIAAQDGSKDHITDALIREIMDTTDYIVELLEQMEG